jgi:Xaa-Pro aminopeptidase
MPDLVRFQKAIREERLDGWLFVNFAHRDRLTDTLLGLDPASVATRRWFYFIPTQDNPLKLVHTLERTILDGLPGATEVYASFAELNEALSRLSGLRVAILCDPTLQVLSTFDAASADLVRSMGIETVSAAPIVQRVHGLLDTRGIESHERAARTLYKSVHKAWTFLESAFARGTPPTETAVRDYLLALLDESGLITDSPPIVASGPNAGNPHYSPNGNGRTLEGDEILQFDIWAKEPGGIYADISWVGFTGTRVPERAETRFAELIAARDLVFPALETALSSGTSTTGADLDRLVRARLAERFPPSAIRHRTGHGIDTECHGTGVNLDSVEFPDHRKILEGSCFSVEPGIYFDDEGYRTEIDIYIQDGKPIVSGGSIQQTLLKFQDRNP